MINNHVLKIVVILLLVISTGCNSSVEESSENVELRIGYYSDEMFKQRYADLIDSTYPGIRYTVVPMMDVVKGQTDGVEWLLEHPVDLIYIPSYLMKNFVSQNALLDLEFMIKEDRAEIAFRPEIIELTRSYGNGKIYGFPSVLNGKAVVYNKQLFDSHGVDYPTDYMSWKQVIQLASRFSEVGLVYSSPYEFELVWDIGKTNNEYLYEANPPQVTVNKQFWAETLELVADPMQNGNVIVEANSFNSFLEGNAAMGIIDIRHFNIMRQMDLNFQWSIVSIPINQSTGFDSELIHVEGFFAIPAATNNEEAALKLLQFLNSDKVTNGLQASNPNIGITTKVIDHPNEFERALHQVTPIVPHSELPYDLFELGHHLVSDVIYQSKPIDEALKTFEIAAMEFIRSNPPLFIHGGEYEAH